MSDSLRNETTTCPDCGGNGTSDGADCHRCAGCGRLFVCCGYPVEYDEHPCADGEESPFTHVDYTIAERLKWMARGNSIGRNDASLMYAAELLEDL